MSVTIKINSFSTNIPYSFNHRSAIDATLQLPMAPLNKPQGSTSRQFLKTMKQNKN